MAINSILPLSERTIARFWSKVRRGKGCWEWTACCFDTGYGCIGAGGKVWGAHRISWLIRHGAIKGKLHVLHSCDNPKCVRPSHLFLGTHADNMADKAKKGRARTGDKAIRVEIMRRRAARGDRHPNSKLTVVQRREIIRLCKQGERLQAVADKYGVCYGTVLYVLNKWRDV